MPYLAISLLSMFGFAWLGRYMAIARNRHGFVWGFSSAVFPPLLLILKFLRTLPNDEHTDQNNPQEN
jgi:hypothetical protein